MNIYLRLFRVRHFVLRPLPESCLTAGSVVARGIWYLWLGFIVFSTLFLFPMGDCAFAQGTGNLSAVAILLTLKSRLRSFRSVKQGMTVEQVRTRMHPYSSFASQMEPPLRVDASGVRQWWLRSDYSGKLNFSHNDPDSVNGVYDVTFTNGKVAKILLYDD